MKRRTVKKINHLLAVLALICVTSSRFSYGQDDDQLLSETEDILNSEQIDIDGAYKKPKSAADRIAEMRKKLEKKNENMVSKKIEDMRIKEEMNLTNKLQDAFDGNIKAMNETPEVKPEVVATPVVVVQAAPVVEAPIVEPKKENAVKVAPTFGIVNLKGKDVDFESKLNMGFLVEAMMNERFSLGLKFNYATMELSEIDSKYNNYNYYSNYNTGYTPYGPGYQSQYGNGRTMSYQQYSFGVQGKFYISTGRILPYVGLGGSYNRASVKYDDQNKNDPYYYNSIYYGDEEYTSSYFTGSLLIGSDIKFTDNVGMMLEFSYAKGTSGFSSKSDARSRYVNPDQIKLEEIGKSIEKADALALNAGLIIVF